MLPFEAGGRSTRGSTGYVTAGMLPQYLRRLLHYPQMDVEYTFTQMVLLCTAPSKVYRLTSLRKQTKNQWARDDPAFVAVLSAFLLLSTVAYGVAFRVSGVGAWLWMLAQAMGQFLLGGALVATAGWWFANKHLRVHHSHSVEQEVEWLYAFDIHCNAYFPLFVLLHPVQYLLLPLLLSQGGLAFLGLLLGNALYAGALIAYTYVHFLGYMSLPFLHRTQVFLYPAVAVGLVAVLCCVLGINLPGFVLSIYLPLPLPGDDDSATATAAAAATAAAGSGGAGGGSVADVAAAAIASASSG